MFQSAFYGECPVWVEGRVFTALDGRRWQAIAYPHSKFSRRWVYRQEDNLRPIEFNNCDYMTREAFIQCVEVGLFTDYDGFGELATKDEVSDIRVLPSNGRILYIDPKWTHVCWYNR
jgi:hypothetical protein